MAASNSTALAEILGIPSSSSSSVYPSAVASPVPGVRDSVPGLATPTTTAAEAQDPIQKLTTSSQSVADYFKAKLGAKAHGERQACTTLAAVGGAAVPPLAPARNRDDDDDRAGLGLGRGPPRVLPPPDNLDEEPVRGGIGALSSSSSRFMTMFMPAQPTIETQEDITATAGIEPVVSHDAHHDDNLGKIEKRRAKEERRREKEEKRRKKAETGQVDRATVDDVPVHEAPAAGTQKKLRDSGAPDGLLVDSPLSSEAVDTKKRKKRDKDKKSANHRRHED
jgi:Pin2-interacting protein X1